MAVCAAFSGATVVGAKLDDNESDIAWFEPGDTLPAVVADDADAMPPFLSTAAFDTGTPSGPPPPAALPGDDGPLGMTANPAMPQAPLPGWGERILRSMPLGPDSSLAGLPPLSDQQPTSGAAIFVGYDSWKGTSDGEWQNNGINTGANFGTRLGDFSDWTSIGFQAGGSVGVYKWAGTEDSPNAQVQGFFTYGFFRRSTEESPWNAALVNDWMVNSNFGSFNQDPLLTQLRGQLGYAVSASDEFGIWGAWRVNSYTKTITVNGWTDATTWRAMNQINVYWHHKWAVGGADTVIWVGVPERNRLKGGGSVGDYIANALVNYPLNDRIAAYGMVTYMHPSASPGLLASRDETWNFVVGISYYPRLNARTSTVAGQRWMPLMNVANNGTFFVDSNHNY